MDANEKVEKKNNRNQGKEIREGFLMTLNCNSPIREES